jgi:hypothetical protein
MTSTRAQFARSLAKINAADLFHGNPACGDVGILLHASRSLPIRIRKLQRDP